MKHSTVDLEIFLLRNLIIFVAVIGYESISRCMVHETLKHKNQKLHKFIKRSVLTDSIISQTISFHSM